MNRATNHLRSGCAAILAPAGIAILSMAYVLAWPPTLNQYDESIYLYEALRVFRGEVMYRDFFDVTAPGFIYAMAAAYRLFAPTLATAKAAMALVHAGIGVAAYACARALGASRGAAVLAALAPLAVAYTGLPQVSPHWVGTLLTLLLVLLVVRMRTDAPPAAWLLPGLVVGTLAVCQQQRGAVMAVGLATTIVVRRLAARGQPEAPRPLPALVWLALGMAVVTVPVVVAIVLAAGGAPVSEALLEQYVHYWRVNPSSFSFVGLHLALRVLVKLAVGFAAVDFIRYGLVAVLPLVVLVMGVRAIWSTMSGQPATGLLSAATLGLFAVLSVGYNFDLCHMAIVSPVLLMLLAPAAEQGLGRVGPWPRLVASGCATVVLGGMLVLQLVRARQAMPWRYDSPFGRVAAATAGDALFFDAVRARMSALGDDRVFAYPTDPGVYLLTGGRNPSRFQILLPTYNTPAQWAEVYRALDARAVSLVLISPYFLRADDPFRVWVRARYPPASLPVRGPYQVFERSPATNRRAEAGGQ